MRKTVPYDGKRQRPKKSVFIAPGTPAKLEGSRGKVVVLRPANTGGRFVVRLTEVHNRKVSEKQKAEELTKLIRARTRLAELWNKHDHRRNYYEPGLTDEEWHELRGLSVFVNSNAQPQTPQSVKMTNLVAVDPSDLKIKEPAQPQYNFVPMLQRREDRAKTLLRKVLDAQGSKGRRRRLGKQITPLRALALLRQRGIRVNSIEAARQLLYRLTYKRSKK